MIENTEHLQKIVDHLININFPKFKHCNDKSREYGKKYTNPWIVKHNGPNKIYLPECVEIKYHDDINKRDKIIKDMKKVNYTDLLNETNLFVYKYGKILEIPMFGNTNNSSFYHWSFRYNSKYDIETCDDIREDVKKTVTRKLAVLKTINKICKLWKNV